MIRENCILEKIMHDYYFSKPFLLISLLLVILLCAQTLHAFSRSFPKLDSTIVTQVTNRIAAKAEFADLSIEVSAADGVVSLSGAVPNETLANQLIAVARSVAGVSSVDASNLKIAGKLINPDLTITANILAIYGKKGWRELKVKTVKGIVTLSGVVDSEDKANTAEDLAQAIPGVKEVNSTIEVIPPEDSPPPRVQQFRHYY